MTDFQQPSPIDRSIAALKKDLLRDGGPQISTVRHYNFAILPYPPAEEFRLRQEIHRLSEELRAGGWTIGQISLNQLLLARIRAAEPDFYDTMVEREKRLAGAADPRRGLRTLKERIVNMADGPDGIAKDVIREVHRVLDENPENANRTVIFLTRAGALYPFLRTSALLKHLTGQTRNAPVVLLYPGTVDAEGGLSFMGVLPADRDYRPRIYR